MSKRQISYWLGAALISLLAACGGGGGGDRAAGVEDGPPPPNQTPPPAPPVTPSDATYADADEIVPAITGVTVDTSASAFVVVEFQLTDGDNNAISDLPRDEVRFTLAKLQTSPLGSGTGNWQSYVNDIETADTGIGPGTEDKLQATYERDDEDIVSDVERDGTLENLGDGNYRYTFATDLEALPQEILDQAAVEGLDLSYDPTLTHRVAMQFDGAANAANPFFDFVPATGESVGIFNRQIALTDNCNRCHNPLGIHGGNRIEVEYCVTCHNPGSTDANSGNTVDLKVMIHKIHRGRNLTNLPYIIWGFRNSEHDYSDIAFPQDIRNCQNCHVGTGTTNDFYTEVALSNQGDNWNEYPSRAACGSCHDNVDFSTHRGGQPDDSRCSSCHSPTSGIGPRAAHELLNRTESQNYLPEIVSISNTGQGEFPTVEFRINNPQTGTPWNILTDAPWTVSGGASRLAVDISWDTGDYNNTGNDSDSASAVSIDALADATGPTTDGIFTVTSTVAIPDGTAAPNIAANGSGGVNIEGHPAVEVEEGEGEERIFMQNVNDFYSINEADGIPVPRRDVVELTECLDCHQDLVLHGENRANNIQACVMCHNPRNTDREVRAVAVTPPTDGKDEESLNFSNMVHGIHAAAKRTNPLQIVGFRGFNTYVYDEEHVHFPGDLADCRECHGKKGYQLPLADTVLGTTIDTGADHASPVDDTVISPTANACYACHETDGAKAHMEFGGASFSTTQADLDDGTVEEQCVNCHGPGENLDVEWVHGLLD